MWKWECLLVGFVYSALVNALAPGQTIRKLLKKAAK
jgi:hypothetical protein